MRMRIRLNCKIGLLKIVSLAKLVLSSSPFSFPALSSVTLHSHTVLTQHPPPPHFKPYHGFLELKFNFSLPSSFCPRVIWKETYIHWVPSLSQKFDMILFSQQLPSSVRGYCSHFANEVPIS